MANLKNIQTIHNNIHYQILELQKNSDHIKNQEIIDKIQELYMIYEKLTIILNQLHDYEN